MIEKSTPFWEAIRSAIRLCSLTYVFVNRFSSNLEYILVLSMSRFGLLVGKFRLFLTVMALVSLQKNAFWPAVPLLIAK